MGATGGRPETPEFSGEVDGRSLREPDSQASALAWSAFQISTSAGNASVGAGTMVNNYQARQAAVE